MSHTPGPWRAQKDPLLKMGDCSLGWQVWSCDVRVAFTEQQNVGSVAEADNARLIAAAPEMLELLKLAVQDCPCSLRERESGHRIDCWGPAAIELIAKVEEVS